MLLNFFFVFVSVLQLLVSLATVTGSRRSIGVEVTQLFTFLFQVE